jgi:protein disulfide-isomerase-like protein
MDIPSGVLEVYKNKRKFLKGAPLKIDGFVCEIGQNDSGRDAGKSLADALLIVVPNLNKPNGHPPPVSPRSNFLVEPVKVVVADTFNGIVMDTTKDVLVEFYATWCGRCRYLAPTYEAVAKKLAGVKSIVIAKMEATENDVPPEMPITIEGFPTIKLFKATTNEIVDFSGERTAEGFVQFLKDNAAIKFDLDDELGL